MKRKLYINQGINSRSAANEVIANMKDCNAQNGNNFYTTKDFGYIKYLKRMMH